MSATLELDRPLVTNYSSMLAKVWISEDEAARLAEDPTTYARKMGMPVQPGAIVEIDRRPHDGPFSEEEVIEAWTATPGRHVLHVPAKPEFRDDELTDVVSSADSYVVIIIVLPF